MDIYVITLIITGLVAILDGYSVKENKVKKNSLFCTSAFSFFIALLIYNKVIEGVYFFLIPIFYAIMTFVHNSIYNRK